MTPRALGQRRAVEGAAEGAEAVAVGGADEEEVVVAGPLGAGGEVEAGAVGEADRVEAVEGDRRGLVGDAVDPDGALAALGRVVDPLDQVPGERRGRRPPSRPRPTSASWCAGPGSRPIRRRRRGPRAAGAVPASRPWPCIGTPARLRVQPQPVRRSGRSIRSARPRRGSDRHAGRARRSAGGDRRGPPRGCPVEARCGRARAPARGPRAPRRPGRAARPRPAPRRASPPRRRSRRSASACASHRPSGAASDPAAAAGPGGRHRGHARESR